MRYRRNVGDDNVNHLIGECLRSKADARRVYDILIARKQMKIDLITGSIHLTPEEHSEFVERFSSEIEPTIWESSFRKH